VAVRRRATFRRFVAVTSVTSACLLVLGTAALAQPAPNVDTAATAPAVTPATVAIPAAQRTDVLGNGWQTATDEAWTTSGDADGFHILIANAKQGYAWRMVATLCDPSVDADAWIGNACVTASGRRAVVAYAPRTFTNDPTLFARVDVPGQLTSAVPAAAGIVAADSGALVRVDQTGARHVVASTSGVPFRLAVDGDGVVYLKRAGKDQVQVRRVTAATLATGSLVDVDVTASHGGRVFVTGKARRTAATPATVSIVDTPKGAPLSLQGKLALISGQ
jgi:hypothetical protein